MKSWKARIALVLAMIAMTLTVSGAALADHDVDEDGDGIEDVEFSDLYWVEDEDGDWEICYDVTYEYEDETEETSTECEDVSWAADDFEE